MLTKQEIRARIEELDKECREARKKVYESQLEERRQLREMCGKMGHDWQYSGPGMFHGEWYYCAVCGETQFRSDIE